MKKAITILVILCTVAGCAKRVPRTDTFAGQSLKVGTIKVTVDEGALGDDRSEVFQKVDGETQIRDKLQNILTQAQLMSPSSDVVLDVHIDSFRLRHGATRYFTGVFSGSDHLQGTMSLTQGERTLLTKPIRVSGGNGNPFNISRNSRAQGLIGGFGNSVLNALRNDALQAPSVVVATAPTATLAKSEKRKVIKATPEVSPGTDKCSIEQVLSMKKTGLTDAQIRAACRGAM